MNAEGMALQYDTFILTNYRTEVDFGFWLQKQFAVAGLEAYYCPMPSIDKVWRERADESKSMIHVVSLMTNPDTGINSFFYSHFIEYTVKRPTFRVAVARMRGAGVELVHELLRPFPSIYFKEGNTEEFDSLLHMITGSSYRRSAPRIFLCHASEDKPKVDKLFTALRLANFDPWYDKERLVVGDRWQDKIECAIRDSDYFMICLSAVSAQKRGYVNREIRQAIKEFQERPFDAVYLLPVLIDACTVPHVRLDSETALDDYQWQTVDVDDDDSINKLVWGIRKQWESRQQGH